MGAVGAGRGGVMPLGQLDGGVLRRRLLPVLGPRAVVVHDGVLGLNSLRPPHWFVVGVEGAGGQVVGRAEAWPIQSESATGALVFVADGEIATRSVREASRVLQPGGVAAFYGAWTAEGIAALDEAIRRAALIPGRRLAVRVDRPPTAVESALRWLAAWRARGAGPGERVFCAVTAAAPGGFATEMPTGRSIVEAMFVPRGLGRARR